jgi:hypothetical protein
VIYCQGGVIVTVLSLSGLLHAVKIIPLLFYKTSNLDVHNCKRMTVEVLFFSLSALKCTQLVGLDRSNENPFFGNFVITACNAFINRKLTWRVIENKQKLQL